MAREKKRPPRDNCTWTQEEDDMLLDMVGTSNYSFIGNKLGRSPRAVQNRLIELGEADKLFVTGMLTAAELGRLVQRDKSYIIKLINEDKLPAIQKDLSYKQRDKKGLRWLIDPYKFWKWADKNRDKLNFYLIEKNSIPPEPDWVDEQRSLDYQKPVTRRRWTEEEKQKAIKLLDQGYSRPQVAKVLNRSVSSIRWILDKHLKEIGVK
jgi:hypothetical protein